MIYTAKYNFPVGNVLVAVRNQKLIGLWIEGQENFLSDLNEEVVEDFSNETLIKVKKWLDRYFSSEKVDINDLELEFIGSPFRRQVWEILCKIPYGRVVTYKDIACILARERGIKKMSAQAVGGAVGHNPISIIVPCHRVVGSNGSLTGYTGGLKIKKYLLEQEGIEEDKLLSFRVNVDDLDKALY